MEATKSGVENRVQKIRDIVCNVNTDDEVEQIDELLDEIDECVSEIPDDTEDNPSFW